MIDQLKPIWQQSQETYACIRMLIDKAPAERLHWVPGPEMWSISYIVQHIARANRVYSTVMEGKEPVRPPFLDAPGKAELGEILDRSEEFVADAFERIGSEDLTARRADDWSPLGVDVEGPLNGLWFALQIVRHNAYHAGQISYILQLP